MWNHLLCGILCRGERGLQPLQRERGSELCLCVSVGVCEECGQCGLSGSKCLLAYAFSTSKGVEQMTRSCVCKARDHATHLNSLVNWSSLLAWSDSVHPCKRDTPDDTVLYTGFSMPLVNRSSPLAQGDSVYIPAGVTILLDVSPPPLVLLLIDGVLKFDTDPGAGVGGGQVW